jgi:predicted dehydrogenase
MHTLAFLDPGHFHAALTLGKRHPKVSEEIFVYAPPGAELDDFLALVEAFNRRAAEATAWRPNVRAGDRSLERLIADRPGDVVILAGRNDRKMAMMRRLHGAGFHVLADKPWLAGPDGLDDLRHTLSGRPLAVEIMTGRHEITSRLTRKLVGESEVFGGFEEGDMGKPAIEISGVHHLEKTVNGAPLRRPVWYFDVRVQGDGIADIPTHMVDQVQQLVAAASPGGVAPSATLELLAARRWATQVPRALFARVTGRPDFPPELRDVVTGSELSYLGNAEMSLRLGTVTAALDTRWDLSVPPGGGDAHHSVIRGTRAEIRVEQNAETGFRRRLSVLPRREPDRVRVALERAVAAWQDTHPGLAVSEAGAGWEIRVPRELDAGHESHFSLVLADFLTLVERGSAASNLAEETLAKYTLLTRASIEARRHIPQ